MLFSDLLAIGNMFINERDQHTNPRSKCYNLQSYIKFSLDLHLVEKRHPWVLAGSCIDMERRHFPMVAAQKVASISHKDSLSSFSHNN